MVSRERREERRGDERLAASLQQPVGQEREQQDERHAERILPPPGLIDARLELVAHFTLHTWAAAAD